MGIHVKPVPDGFHTVNVYLTVPNSVEAFAFYEKAFGAKTDHADGGTRQQHDACGDDGSVIAP